MNTKQTTLLALFLIAAAVLAGLALWGQLPPQMDSHWNANDEADGQITKFWGVFLMPLTALGMLILFLFLPSIDPLKENIAQFREAYNLFIAVLIGFLVYVHGLTLVWNLGDPTFKMSAAMLPFMGVLFIASGSLLKKAKRNFFIGIRTPWTLSSDLVWDKTHQLGSKLFLFCGVCTIVGGFLGGMAAIWLVFAPLLGSTLFLTVYSYLLYRNEKTPPAQNTY